jgi:prepilin-type processing-associated H-X9-DG protein/prepilin-type N-terminal cleavage/methylation domain-containing protein
MKTKPAVKTARKAAPNLSVCGFTLVELLVVVGVIAILAGLLLPSLSQAKGKAHSTACLNNQKQLALAFLLYVDDFEDNLPYNLGETETKQTIADGTFLNWVNNVMSWFVEPDNTNTVQEVRGGLGPYTSRSASLYRCPSDSVVSDLQRDAGWRQRVRSYSMNAMIGNAGEFTAAGKNVNNPSYKQFFKLNEIPDPSRIFVFIEEHPDSIDDGYFLNQAEKYEWHDLPASYHSGGANLAFADGHIEYHKWMNGGTRAPAKANSAVLPAAVVPGYGQDFHWVLDRTSTTTPVPTPSYPPSGQ